MTDLLSLFIYSVTVFISIIAFAKQCMPTWRSATQNPARQRQNVFILSFFLLFSLGQGIYRIIFLSGVGKQSEMSSVSLWLIVPALFFDICFCWLHFSLVFPILGLLRQELCGKRMVQVSSELQQDANRTACNIRRVGLYAVLAFGHTLAIVASFLLLFKSRMSKKDSSMLIEARASWPLAIQNVALWLVWNFFKCLRLRMLLQQWLRSQKTSAPSDHEDQSSERRPSKAKVGKEKESESKRRSSFILRGFHQFDGSIQPRPQVLMEDNGIGSE